MDQQAFALAIDPWASDHIHYRGRVCDLLYCPTGDFKDCKSVRYGRLSSIGNSRTKARRNTDPDFYMELTGDALARRDHADLK